MRHLRGAPAANSMPVLQQELSVVLACVCCLLQAACCTHVSLAVFRTIWFPGPAAAVPEHIVFTAMQVWHHGHWCRVPHTQPAPVW